MLEGFLKSQLRRRVVNRQLGAHILAALDALGQMTTFELAIAAYGGPGSLRRRRLIAAIIPTVSQMNATSRSLRRLSAAEIVVATGRRRRRKLFRLRRDAELLASLTLGVM